MPRRSMAASSPWAALPDLLRARGMRWTPQRRTLIDVLARADGHLTGAELIDRCRDLDASTTPSTVYRTLDVLEELGLIRHGHGPDGREEFHVLPTTNHGHLHCAGCGTAWELGAGEARGLVSTLRRGRGFEVDLSHVTVVGRCAACVAAAAGASGADSARPAPDSARPAPKSVAPRR